MQILFVKIILYDFIVMLICRVHSSRSVYTSVNILYTNRCTVEMPMVRERRLLDANQKEKKKPFFKALMYVK